MNGSSRTSFLDGAQVYYLYVGSTLGAKDLVNTGEITRTYYRLPAGLARWTVYMRLLDQARGTWRYVDKTVSLLGS